MLVKLLLYIFFTFVSAFGLSGVNFSGIIKSGKVIESKVLVMVYKFFIWLLINKFCTRFFKYLI